MRFTIIVSCFAWCDKPLGNLLAITTFFGEINAPVKWVNPEMRSFQVDHQSLLKYMKDKVQEQKRKEKDLNPVELNTDEIKKMGVDSRYIFILEI